MTTTTTAKDYGASAPELETLRRLVTAQVPAVRFGGFTPSGAANGEYSFRLPNGLSAWVRSPTAPKGRQRARHPGHWLFRLTCEPGGGMRPWDHAHSVNRVLDWLANPGRPRAVGRPPSLPPRAATRRTCARCSRDWNSTPPNGGLPKVPTSTHPAAACRPSRPPARRRGGCAATGPARRSLAELQAQAGCS